MYLGLTYGVIVSWYSKKQRTISTSTTKTKYIALGHATYESIWIRQFLNKLEIAELIGICTIFGDNKMNIIPTKNAKSQVRTKDIDV